MRIFMTTQKIIYAFITMNLFCGAVSAMQNRTPEQLRAARIQYIEGERYKCIARCTQISLNDRLHGPYSTLLDGDAYYRDQEARCIAKCNEENVGLKKLLLDQ